MFYLDGEGTAGTVREDDDPRGMRKTVGSWRPTTTVLGVGGVSWTVAVSVRRRTTTAPRVNRPRSCR